MNLFMDLVQFPKEMVGYSHNICGTITPVFLEGRKLYYVTVFVAG